MRILPPVEEEIRRVIRDQRAKDPLISVSGLEAALEKHFNRGFSHQYVSKVADKVARQALIEIDRAKIEERLAFTRENYRMMREKLIEIVNWTPEKGRLTGAPKPLARDQVDAAKNIVMMDLALLGAEVANGMYRKDETPSEVLARNVPMPADQRELVLGVFARWGMMPKQQDSTIAGPPIQLPHAIPATANDAAGN